MLTDRKNEHLDIVLDGRGVSRTTTGFDDIVFEHYALPELDLDAIDLNTQFLGKRINAPLLVSSMTGGPARASAINAHLAEACQHLGIALAVGSQRVAIESGDVGGLGAELRRHAPDIPILANFGAAQLNLGFGVDEARRAIEMIGADALIIHLNPLQEAVQPEGDRNWRGLFAHIETLAARLDEPLVIKEVGAGISGRLARRLADAGVSVIDVAGAGGTSWAAVESERCKDPRQAAIGRAFADWGIPTATAIADVRAACPDTTIVGSGGIRNGLDAAKAIRLGADVVGQAAGVLQAATISAQAVIDHVSVTTAQLRIACFCTGSANLKALRTAALL
ncbi:isopentenyl-diphosphate delta-isomerase [Devosia lucknowensis]|uniref:Isopentenyl-diphosphate delta-isomerase n=1 Tax=Devosia lucknowensis TaxID=1096929 RepID=A0A1Y6EX83_9HYPH|nr:type 2 isopentenyl-diphosphate Delta-isomerase [Devosia lucknowensis]SMQ65142.1 isopentenyl-diphosphate delta-isomerase [Devosia lucknowensis]